MVLSGCFLFFSVSVSAESLVEKLGYPAESRLLIINCDDVGMCHAANMAAIEGQEKGMITSGTIMVPCPWFPEIAAYAKDNPELNFGVHLTHTSEWESYRWGPVAPDNLVPGLLDPEGYCWRNVPLAYENTVKIADQIDLRMPSQETLEERGAPADLRTQTAALGLIFPDYFVYGVLGNDYTGNVEESWFRILSDLNPGVTEIYIHASTPGEELKAATNSWKTRVEEYNTFTSSERLKGLFKEQNIKLISYKPLKDLQRKNHNGSETKK